jgi:prepilin-type N-terminal cleavage/methylation domain-containing protein
MFILPSRSQSGFSLAELLICLLILGEIATFTIPKVVTSQQNARKNAITREVFSSVAAAYQQYVMSNTLTSNTEITNLTQYMNYTKLDTSSLVDGSLNDSASYSCGSRTCLRLHSGAVVAFGATIGAFGGTNTTNMQWFLVDPDGTYGADASSVWGVLYYNGRVTSWAKIAPNSADGGGTYNPGNYDPAWFQW